MHLRNMVHSLQYMTKSKGGGAVVGGGSKNYQEIKSGAELILLLRTGATK